MSFEQSTPINLQLSNNSLEISNSQISKNQTPIYPSNQESPKKNYQQEQNIIYGNKKEININKTENKIIIPTNFFSKFPLDETSNYISFCYTKLPRGGIVTFPSLKHYGTNENDPRNQKLYMIYIKNCIIKIQRNIRKYIHVIQNQKNFNNGGIVDLFHRSKSLDTIYYRRNKNNYLFNHYNLLSLDLFYFQKKNQTIKKKKILPFQITKEYKNNYPHFQQKVISQTFKLRSQNNLKLNKIRNLKNQIADIWIEECIPENLNETIFISKQEKKNPKFKIERVESFKLKPLSLLYSTGTQTYNWEESNRIIKKNINLFIEKIQKEICSLTKEKYSFQINNDPFIFNQKNQIDDFSKINFSFDKIDKTLLYRIAFGNFFSLEKTYERRIWNEMVSIENPINIFLMNKQKSIFYSVNSTNNIDYEIQIGKSQKEIMYTLTKKDISYIWNRSNEIDNSNQFIFIGNEEGDKLTFREGEEEPIPEKLEIKPKNYTMENTYSESIHFKKNNNYNDYDSNNFESNNTYNNSYNNTYNNTYNNNNYNSNSNYNNSINFGTQYDHNIVNNNIFYIEKFNFGIIHKMKNMFENTVINSIEPVETFNFYDKNNEVNLEINKINISNQNYKSKSNKKNPLNINYDVDTPPLKEPLYNEEEIPNYMIEKWNKLNRFSPRNVIVSFLCNIKNKKKNNLKNKFEMNKRDSFSLISNYINYGLKNSNLGNFNYIEESSQYNLKDLNINQNYYNLNESNNSFNQVKPENEYNYNNKSIPQENSNNSFSNIRPTNIQNDEYIEQIKLNLMKSVNKDKLKNSRINNNNNNLNNYNNYGNYNNMNNKNFIPSNNNNNRKNNSSGKSPYNGNRNNSNNKINNNNIKGNIGKNKINSNGINILNKDLNGRK